MKSTTTPIVQTHNDFAPELDTHLTPAHLWAEFWPQVVNLIEPLAKDLHLIGEMLTSIDERLEQANKNTESAAEINKIQLDAIRAQMPGGILKPTIVVDSSQKRR